MTTILIVDDKVENLYLLDLLLKSKGHEVVQAHNGHQALEAARQKTPDLIISDILMPDMDGFSLCREVKKDETLSKQPFVFYTATYTDEKDEAYALSLGADRFIKKPTDPTLFINQVTQVINEYKHSTQSVGKAVKMEEDESYKLYSERLIQKLEKKMLDLEIEVERRIEVEEDLRHARNEWEETFQAIASPALLIDTDYNIVQTNRSANKMLKTKDRKLIGKKCYEVFHPGGQSAQDCPLSSLHNTDKPQNLQIEVESFGGVYLLNCAPLTNEEGKVEKIIHIALDITERKRAEDRLKESEDRYRRLTDNAKDMIYRMSLPDGIYEFISPASKELFGYSPSAFYDSPKLIKACLHPDWLDYFHNEWNLLIAGKMSPTYEYQINHKNGDIRWMHQRNAMVIDEDGTPIAIEGIVTDITDRKNMEVELKQSGERFRLLVENINELFWIRDAQTQEIRYISPIFEKIFGMSTSEMYHDPFAFKKAIIEEDLPIMEKAHQDQMQHGKTTAITYRIRRDDGIRWIRSRAFPVRNESGKVTWIAGIAEDITKAQQAENEHKKLEGQLFQSQKLEAIGTLAGGIAHDFNNILSAIIGYTELIIDDPDIGPDNREYLSEVLSAGLRAKELVRQILTLTRKSDNLMEPVKVRLVVKEAIKLIRSTISTNIEIREQINSPSLVMASPAQLHQVFMNLLTNAAHAMRAKGGILVIKLSEVNLEKCPAGDPTNFKPGRYIKTVISDTGEGIPKQYIDDIFNAYFTTKDIGEGTGLGLSISYGIIQNCGGSIMVNSQVGRGTTFTFFLPISSVEAQPQQKKLASLATGTERILIVDDEPAIAQLIIRHLTRLGYTVTTSTSSLDSLALFKKAPNDFDLVVTDMAMPHMTGDKLSIELLKIRPDLRIILCTGFSHGMSEKDAKRIGIRDFAMKPLSIVDLANRIRKALDNP